LIELILQFINHIYLTTKIMKEVKDGPHFREEEGGGGEGVFPHEFLRDLRKGGLLGNQFGWEKEEAESNIPKFREAGAELEKRFRATGLLEKYPEIVENLRKVLENKSFETMPTLVEAFNQIDGYETTGVLREEWNESFSFLRTDGKIFGEQSIQSFELKIAKDGGVKLFLTQSGPKAEEARKSWRGKLID
jgi:hypothetical protein